MTANSVPAYTPYMDDPEMLSPFIGIRRNVLQSCSRQISACYRSTPIPGTTYTGIDVFIDSMPNSYFGSQDVDTLQHRIIVLLSVVNTDFEELGYNYYGVLPTVSAKIKIPEAAMGRDDANGKSRFMEAERQYRDMGTRDAIVEGLFLALLVVPYYKGDEFMETTFSAMTMNQVGDPMSPELLIAYRVVTGVDAVAGKPARLTINIKPEKRRPDPDSYGSTYVIDPAKKPKRPFAKSMYNCR